MKNRIAIIDGIRTPMAKAGTELKSVSADDLGAFAVKELLARSEIDTSLIDELIFGNVSMPADAANIARVIALKSGLPQTMPSYTVQRNCASGAESITTAADKINAGEASIIIAGGTESMSHYPLLYNKQMTGLFERLFKSKSLWAKFCQLLSFRPGHLKPVISVLQGLRDPICGMMMGSTADLLAREFHITREEQDEFALLSHERATEAINGSFFADEIIPVPILPDYNEIFKTDSGPRKNQNMEALEKLKPYFDKREGTVTVGNSCPLTDGAAALLLMSEEKAKELGYTPLGFLRDYAYAGLEPERMGLGPVYATNKLLNKSGIEFDDFGLIELNEAFAAQVIANEKAFASKSFAKEFLNRDKEIGEIDREALNINGGAIALGHPVGMTGTRMILTLLKSMKRKDVPLGLATMCIGGGQGAALALETA
ncbi:MAG: thiolase family protein [Lentisphaeria bacterium]|nr:thiolase family protein [Lentisphaeria bacterium]NQZ70655.1 thiolase family protein [Lentisphaeria bacterium]